MLHIDNIHEDIIVAEPNICLFLLEDVERVPNHLAVSYSIHSSWANGAGPHAIRVVCV